MGSIRSLYCASQQSQTFFSLAYHVESCAQPKIIFSLRKELGEESRLLNLDQLQKRGMALANRCLLCLECGESVDHLLTSSFTMQKRDCCGSYCSHCLVLLG